MLNNKETKSYICSNSKQHHDGLTRVFKLDNGTIFTIRGKEKEYTLEYEDMLLYEVEFKGYDEYMQSIYERNGVVFTPEEVNKLV